MVERQGNEWVRNLIFWHPGVLWIVSGYLWFWREMNCAILRQLSPSGSFPFRFFFLSLVNSLIASCRCQKRWRISVLLLWLKITRHYWSSFSKLVADSAEEFNNLALALLTNNYARSRRFNTRTRSPLRKKETRFSKNSLLSFRIV